MPYWGPKNSTRHESYCHVLFAVFELKVGRSQVTTPPSQVMTVLVMYPYSRFVNLHINLDSPHILRIYIIFRISTDPRGCPTRSTNSTARKELLAFDYFAHHQVRISFTLQPTSYALQKFPDEFQILGNCSSDFLLSWKIINATRTIRLAHVALFININDVASPNMAAMRCATSLVRAPLPLSTNLPAPLMNRLSLPALVMVSTFRGELIIDV